MLPRPLLTRALGGAALGWLACSTITPARAQTANSGMADDMAAFYNQAVQAFQKGDWAGAASGLEKFIAMFTDPKQQGQLGPMYYMLGASYFNQPDYPKAISTLQLYLRKFPSGEKVWEVRLALAQAFMANKNYDEAIKAYEQLEAVPAYRDQALTAESKAYQEENKPEDRIRVLEKLIAPEIKRSAQANGAIDLAQLYADKSESEKAIGLLEKLETKTVLIENLVALNSVAVKLGDDFAGQKKFKEAIEAYRSVRMRDEVIKFQTERVAALERRIADNIKASAGNPQLFVQMTQWNNQIKEVQNDAKTLLTEFEKLPDFAPAMFARIARCWYDWDKKWESMVIYNQLMTKYPKTEEYEPSLFAMVSIFAELHRIAQTQQLCDRYLKEFPEGPNAGTVGYLSGAVALEAQDPVGAEKFFTQIIEKQPKSTYREEMKFLLANAKFMQGKFVDALKDYQAYLAEYPTGQYLEEITYRAAISETFAGEFEAAMPMLQAFLEKFPTSASAPDAKYRILVCKYAAKQYDEVIAETLAWIKEYPGNVQEGEVQALLGDCYAAENKLELAIPAFVRSYKTAATDEVLNYSLFEASKHMQKLGRWKDVAAMFEEFVQEKPDNPSIVSAMYWIGKAKAREGKTDEAKKFLVDTVKKYLAEPKREAVEQLLSQLAQLCARRPRPIPVATPPTPPAPEQKPAAANLAAATPGAVPTPPPAPEPPPPPPPPYDPVAELDKQLAPLQEGANPTGKARLMYAKAELASVLKKPDEQEKIYAEMAERFKPEDLSPVLLAQVGDYFFQKGDIPRATVIYTKLKEDFPKSDYLDFAYVGLGEIAFGKKDYEKALQLFTDALEKIAASMKVKEATIGKAKTLLELGKYDESKKLFEQVAGVREWRGESTAMAVYELGEVEARQGKWAEAIAHYRRVFVAYQKFAPWVAKAYLRTAESFDKMGDRKAAIENLREMTRNDRLEQFPEMREARKRMKEWGAPEA